MKNFYDNMYTIMAKMAGRTTQSLAAVDYPQHPQPV